MGFHITIKEVLISGGAPLAFLILLSIYSMALVWERWQFFKNSFSGLDVFLGKIRKNIEEENLSQALTISKSYKGLASSVITASLVGSSNRQERKRQADRAASRAAALLEKRLNFLATIASTAPFIGLFGTVVGVIRAFQDLAGAAGAGPGIVAVGISEALVCTATGLLVAIPAVWAYNYFTNKIGQFLDEMNWISEEIIEHLSGKASS